MTLTRFLLVWLAATTNLGTTTLALSSDVSSPNSTIMTTQEHLDLDLDFDAWMIRHDKAYRYSKHSNNNNSSSSSSSITQEYLMRRAIYLGNRRLVDTHNYAYQQGWTLYRMTLGGPFADLSHEEFETTYLMESQNCSATHTSSGNISSLVRFFHNSSQTPPHAVDWRTKGIITPIKNQKQCGSCWTFSTTGCLEAHTCLAHGKDCTAWTGLAEQQLLDCATPYNNHGCNGGLPSQAYEYIKYAGGIDSEDSYPYQANDTDGCRDSGGGDSNSNNNSHGRAAQVAEVFNITSYDEVDLVQAIQYVGPVSIAYQVSADFRFYAHGVYDSYNATTNSTMCKSSPMDVNHAVVAVGIGSTQEGTPFYIVRNSWSTSWGMEGYFWMLRGRNLCGVSDCASFPLVPAATSTTNTNNTMKVVEQHPPVFHLRQKEASTTG